MNTPGDDDEIPSPSPPKPPDPFQEPSGRHVDQPRLGDTGTGDYGTGHYSADAGVSAEATRHPPLREQAGAASAPLHSTSAAPPPSSPQRSESRKGLIAPIAAAVVLIGGIGLLIASSGTTEDPEVTAPPRIAEVRDPDDPTVESTVPTDSVVEPVVTNETPPEPTAPIQTSPPLIEPTTIPPELEPVTTPAVETDPTATGGPTQAELDAALLTIDDIGPGDWTEETPDFEEICDTVPDAATPDARADSLFGTILTDPLVARQISNTLVTYATAELAEQAFTSDVAELVACDGTATEVGGDQYRVQVNSDSFTEEEAEIFPCSDQTSFLIIQLINDDLAVPFIAQSSFAFRCGRNITVTALATTLDVQDLEDENFTNAAVISNVNTGNLRGS